MKGNLFKVASFLGAGIAVILGFITIASGIMLVTLSKPFNGTTTVIAGVICLANAILIYRNFQKVDLDGKPGVKLNDIKNK